VVHNLELCLKEAQRRRNTTFFRDLISEEVEALALERGTDIEAGLKYRFIDDAIVM